MRIFRCQTEKVGFLSTLLPKDKLIQLSAYSFALGRRFQLVKFIKTKNGNTKRVATHAHTHHSSLALSHCLSLTGRKKKTENENK